MPSPDKSNAARCEACWGTGVDQAAMQRAHEAIEREYRESDGMSFPVSIRDAPCALCGGTGVASSREQA